MLGSKKGYYDAIGVNFFTMYTKFKYPVLHFGGTGFMILDRLAAGPVHRKKSRANYEQLLRVVFHVFGSKCFFRFFYNSTASALKSCIIYFI